MPELPEVETVVRSLQPLLTGREICDFQLLWPKTLEGSLPDFIRTVQHQTIQSLQRRGKYIILNLAKGYILIHLRMTGKLLHAGKLPSQMKHVQAWFALDDGSCLYFEDVRKFGRITFRSTLTELDSKLGPEPLSDEFTSALLANILAGTSRHIKPLLLDQSIIAGIGNIYCDEVLWQARIHPLTPAREIADPTIALLRDAIVNTLSEAIEHQGSTIRDFRFQGDRSGNFAERLKVFGRTGLPCPRCKTPVIKLKVAQRGTHICPHCQQI